MKFRKLEILPLGLILFFLCASISPCLAQFAGGTGSEAAPYLVATAQHLNNVRNYPGAFFLQTDDIYLNVEPYNSGLGWLPIGTQSAPFSGSYDGNNFHIYYLYLNQSEGNNLGLFGYAHSAVLKNITLQDVYINGKDYVGSLIGSATECFLESCSSEGTITGASVTGGLVGSLELSCHLEKCFANCVVSGQFATGGLCGYSKGASEIYSSYSKGTVTGNNATGGLVGIQGNSTLSQCFSTSAVQGNWGAGGLLGVNDTQSLVSYCYSLGSVTGNSNTGGLIGRNVVSETLFSYWNVETSGQTISAGGNSRTTAEMTYPYAANTYVDWDLTEIWQPDTQYFVNGGYPYLQWMYPCPPISYLHYQIENYSVILQWSVPYVASYMGFNIYKNGVLYATVTDSIFIDNNVYHTEHYSYQVSALYLGGESILSEPVSFTVYFPPLPANCVFPVNGATEMDILLHLQWSPVAYDNYPLPDGYLLEVMSLAGFSVVNIDVGNVTSYQIPNPLDYETEYYWIVTPYTFGEGNTYLYAEDVPNWYFTTQEQIIKPINLTATIENWKNVQLNWNMEERALQNFNIYRNGTLIGNSYYPSYYDENLSQGEYTYYVTALYETTESEPSNPASVTISYVYPPQNVYAALIDSLLQISWQPSVSGLEQGYIVYRLQEGQEDEEYLWEYIGYTTNGYTFYDSAWQNLPTGNYRWAIKAHFEDDNYSSPAFSNEIIKAPVIAVTPTSIYQELTTAETSQIEITITNNGTAPLNWNSNIVLTRAEQKTGTHHCLIPENNNEQQQNHSREDRADNRMRQSKEDRQMLLRDGKPVNPLSEYGIDEKTDIERMEAEKMYFNSLSRERILSDKFGLEGIDSDGRKANIKDNDRDSTFTMPEINLSPYSGTIEPNSSVTCILTFIPENTPSTYNYELQLSSNDPVSPLITVPIEYVVNSPITYIPDDNFRMAINSALGQPSDYQPTIADLQGLTGGLYADDRNIVSIEGAQYLTNLQVMYLYSNQISDLSPLAGLANLQVLYLDSNQISNIYPLAGLTNLWYLQLGYNQIIDLSPLAGLSNLQVLYLSGNQISDLSPLAGLTNLGLLYLDSNQIIYLSPLAGLTNLWCLELAYNQISDLSPLAGLTNLQELYLAYNQISDIGPLAGLTNLQYLLLEYNQISNISPLVGLTNLKVINLVYNQISNISPLSGLTNLQYLLLDYNQISDLSPLAGLINLRYLELDNNQINDISPLVELTNLQVMYLNNNQISNLSPLAGLTNLQHLYLDYNQISDLSPLAGLINLRYLELDNNQINDISPLVELTNLRSLYLNFNQISDIIPLAELTNILNLWLYNNPISYESMLLAHSLSIFWHIYNSYYNPLSPCYPVPNRGATNVLVNYPLSWRGNYNNSPDVYYEVWLGISPVELFYQGSVTQMVNTTEHLYSFNTNLQANTQYYWRIRAIASADTIWSGMWSFTTGNYGAGNTSMLEPVPVTLAINALQNQVRLSWQRRRDEESYYVYWSENPYAEFPEGWNGPVNVTETSFTDTLSDKCFYRVFAVPNMRGEIENKQNTKPRAIMPKRGE